MSRPPIPRRVPTDLHAEVFKPRGVPMSELETVHLTLDGLEALRLADVEGLYQEEAAQRMGVSRATFARILTDGRKAVAEAILHTRALVVEGGAVTERGAEKWPCPVHHGRRRRGRGCRCHAPAS